MSEKELFKIALKYVEKEYSTEDLRYGDDLYGKSEEDLEECINMYDEIKDEGLKWAYKYLDTLKD